MSNKNPYSSTPGCYYLPTRLYMDWNITEQIGKYTRDIGSRILIVSLQEEAADPERLTAIKTSLDKHTNGAIIYDDIPRRAGPQDLDSLVYFTRQCKADAILAYGGRESLYIGRTTALLATNNVFAAELRSASFPLPNPPLPCITVPIGPVMGEELSPAFSIYVAEEQQTFYGCDPQLFPKITFVDPSLTEQLSTTDIVRLGLATLSTGLEAMLSKNASDIVISHGMQVLELITSNLPQCAREDADKAALQNLCLASIFAGMAHSNSSAGLAYSLASAIYDILEIDFYITLNIVLPYVMEYDLTEKAETYVHIVKKMGIDITGLTIIEAAIKAIEIVRELGMELNAPRRLSEFHVKDIDPDKVARYVEKMDITSNSPKYTDREGLNTLFQAVR